MVHENYTHAFTLNQSYSLEVTLKVINKPAVTDEGTARFLERTPDDLEGLSKFKLPDLDKIYEKIIQIIKKSRAANTLLTNRQQSYMVATSTGFQLLCLNRIVCFDYQPEKKQWIIWLTNQTQLPLKRNTTAGNILNYSPAYVRINQRQIINLDYLERIDDRLCHLTGFCRIINPLIISRSYLKELQKKVEVI